MQIHRLIISTYTLLIKTVGCRSAVCAQRGGLCGETGQYLLR